MKIQQDLPATAVSLFAFLWNYTKVTEYIGRSAVYVFCLFLLLLSGCIDNEYEADNPTPATTDRECINRDTLRNPFFGETHAHTVYSFDAFAYDVRLTPAEAFRFTQGEKVGLPPYNDQDQPMRTAQLDRPLDWAMLSDHAEFFGEAHICTDPSFPEYQDGVCFIYRLKNNLTFNLFGSQMNKAGDDIQRFEFCGEAAELCIEQSATVMQKQIDAAEAANDLSDQCQFTAFVGYEWTGHPQLDSTRELQNIHRNVLFANAHVPARPTSYLDAPYPEDLWRRLTSDCLEGIPDCDVITIPHNSNLSAGLMFEQREKNGRAISVEYARIRARFEPIVELFQHKGASECEDNGSDPECSFEALPWGQLTGWKVSIGESDRPLGIPRDNSFVRHALQEGLALEQSLGENPFKFGLIGATDTHMGIPGMVAEINFPGHIRASGVGEKWDLGVKQFYDSPHLNPGGLAVVWAEQNTRASIFAALKRREVYGTSGPRHVLRLFGGWDYEDNLCNTSDLAQVGYDDGVPMGSDLPPRDNANTPHFVVVAIKDSLAGATDLQRIQIIKGWVDTVGVRQEKIFEVAGNPSNGAGVDLNTCDTTGAGFNSLCTVWSDPEFNPQHSAFYYARVLENPSCRWTTFQCLQQGVICSDPSSGPADMRKVCCEGKSPSEHPDLQNVEIPQTIQERSWSSPIWYIPES